MCDQNIVAHYYHIIMVTFVIIDSQAIRAIYQTFNVKKNKNTNEFLTNSHIRPSPNTLPHLSVYDSCIFKTVL